MSPTTFKNLPIWSHYFYHKNRRKGLSRPGVNVIKLFLEDIQISPKLRHLIKFVMMSEPAQKCENQAIFKQNYTLELFIALEMVYFCCFSLGGNLDFLHFLQKRFIISTTGQFFLPSASCVYRWVRGSTFVVFCRCTKISMQSIYLDVCAFTQKCQRVSS